VRDAHDGARRPAPKDAVRGRPWRARLAPGVAALALLGAGCAALHDRAPVPAPGEGEWAELRNGATRRAQLYDRLDHRATATATYLAPAVRDARAKRLGEWLSWTPEELAARLATERAEAGQYDEFLISFYTANSRENDLDSRSSIWRVALELDEGELLPQKIVAVDADATLVNLFPFVGAFDTVYLVRFPHPSGGPLAGRLFAMEIASALGQLALDFRVPDGPDQPAPP
jgi:hypothetical protein